MAFEQAMEQEIQDLRTENDGLAVEVAALKFKIEQLESALKLANIALSDSERCETALASKVRSFELSNARMANAINGLKEYYDGTVTDEAAANTLLACQGDLEEASAWLAGREKHWTDEVAELRNELQKFWYAQAMLDEIERLRTALAAYANPENWTRARRDGPLDEWVLYRDGTWNGPDLARKALDAK